MKKVLFATTALIASAGIASAQGVELSGSAEMGVVGGSGMETQFWNDIDVTFTLSGETDNGLTFGATIDLDEIDAAGNGIPATSNPASVFLSGSFGTITMGDTDGAFDWALTEVALAGGSIDDSETAHAGYNGNAGLDGSYDGQIARYDYSFGDFAFAVSVELDDSIANETVLGLGGKYSADLGGVDLGIGLGYQTDSAVGGDDIIGLSLTAGMGNGFSAGLNWSDLDNGDDHIGIGVAYTMDALTLAANYGVYSFGDATVADSEGFGLVANYDLGGGAVVQFGYGTGKVDDGGGTNTQDPSVNTWSLGVAMSF